MCNCSVWSFDYSLLWFYDSARHRKDEKYIADMFKAEVVKGQVDISSMLNEMLYSLGAAYGWDFHNSL